MYIAGLGYMGIRENKKAHKLFAEILAIDEMNFDAKSHCNLLETLSLKEQNLCLK